jgi:hypothetical protein
MAYEGDEDGIVHRSAFAIAGAAVVFGLMIAFNADLTSVWGIVKACFGAFLAAAGFMGWVSYWRSL